MTDRRIGMLFLKFLAAAAFLLVTMFIIAMAGGYGLFEVIWHLLTGFAWFLRDNLPRISADAGTWGPGLVAFGLALVVGHFFLRSWAKKRNRPWSAGSTLCAGLVLPLLFAISFLVPGVLLQVERLAEVKWFGSRNNPAILRLQLRNSGHAVFYFEDLEGRLPGSLNELVEIELVTASSLVWTGEEGDSPPEVPIYLGAGLTMESDGSLPLLISPSYMKSGAKVRQVLTMDMEFVQIRDEEVDAWIDKVMAAGKR